MAEPGFEPWQRDTTTAGAQPINFPDFLERKQASGVQQPGQVTLPGRAQVGFLGAGMLLGMELEAEVFSRQT